MFRGRTPRKAIQRQNLLRRAVELVEPLEHRTMLTTLTHASTDLNQSTEFFYFDAAKQVVRIQLFGDIIAEFTAARVRATNNSVVIRDLIPASPPGAPQPKDGADLFNIYVAKADSNAKIVITQMATTDTADRDITPYAGSVGTIRVQVTGEQTDPPDKFITPDSTGAVYIGARTVDINPNIKGEDKIPITKVRYTSSLGVRPNTKYIYAGITTAPGVSLNEVLIAGTITGLVNFEGNVGTFYASNILTGDILGLSVPFQSTTTGPVSGKTSIANNFTVGGNIQNLIVSGSIGTTSAGNFRAGTQIRVGGKLGYQHVGNAFGGSIQVRNSASTPGFNTPVPEVEYVNEANETDGTSFSQGLLSGDLVNNSTAGVNNQFAATYGTEQRMSWTGTIQNALQGDPVDNYSLPLLAGQSAVIKLTTDDGLNVGVFDPLGRYIASDISGVSVSANNQAFTIVAKVPGVYTLAVAFAGSPILGGGVNTFSDSLPYQLDVRGAGNVPLGGSDVGGITRFTDAGNGVAVRTGDLGAWIGRGTVSGTLSASQFGIPGAPINISRGNIRALYGSSVGVQTRNFKESLQLTVPNGSVGYIHATGAAGDVAINVQSIASGDPITSEAIGGDYQRVEATRDVDSGLIANGNIGTIIAGGINAIPTIESFGVVPIFSAGTNQKGAGNIDAIYVSGDVGSTNFSGPGLYTGLDGNVKYFHVGGTVYRDKFFGGTLTATQAYNPGQAVTIKDDSGALATITPTDVVTRIATSPIAAVGTSIGTAVGTITNADGSVTTVTFDPLTSQYIVSTPGALTLTTYGVRGTGGVVLINATSTSSFTVASAGKGGSVDITDAVTNGTGSSVFTSGNAVGYTKGNVDPGTSGATTVDPITGQPVSVFSQTPSIPNPVAFGGTVPINVLNITGTNVTSVANATSGEIVGGNFTSLGSINAETVGQIRSSTNADVVIPTNMTTSAVPFDGFSRGVQVTTNAINIVGRSGIGNVQIGGTVNVVNPNGDGRNARGVADGINGDVQAGRINSISIGEGVASAGTGNRIGAGIFATDTIASVVGSNADIRGPIIANVAIGSVSLTNGSIVNTVVGNLGTFAQGAFINNKYTLLEPATGFSIGSLNITGDGGILGASIIAGRFGSINVDGYGILSSQIFATNSTGASGSITAGGLGLRFDNIDVGGTLGSIKATGNGRVLSIADFNKRVLQTNKHRKFDAYNGRTLSGSNDLNRMFGTSRTLTKISGATNAGVVQDTQIIGEGNLTSLSAYAIASADTDTSLSSAAFPMRIVLANGIGTIHTTSGINGLKIRTGSLDSLEVGTNLQRADIGVAGEIKSIDVGKTIRGTTNIVAQGGNGVIDAIVVRGGLYGIVNATSRIGSIAADVIGATISAGSIGGVLVNLDVLDGSTIRAGRAIDRVIIGRDFQDGAKIDSTGIRVFRVGGTNAGTVVKH